MHVLTGTFGLHCIYAHVLTGTSGPQPPIVLGLTPGFAIQNAVFSPSNPSQPQPPLPPPQVVVGSASGYVYALAGATGLDIRNWPFRARGRVQSPAMVTRLLPDKAGPGQQVGQRVPTNRSNITSMSFDASGL